MRAGNFWVLYYAYVNAFKNNDDRTRRRLQRKWFAREINAKKSRPKELPKWTVGLRKKIMRGWYWYNWNRGWYTHPYLWPQHYYIKDNRKYNTYFGII